MRDGEVSDRGEAQGAGEAASGEFVHVNWYHVEKLLREFTVAIMSDPVLSRGESMSKILSCLSGMSIVACIVSFHIYNIDC